MSPAVSVFIPTRNRGHVIGAALETILDQDLGSEEFEVIVVDDDSDDDTAEVLKAISHPRLTWWTRKREGATALVHARNEAIEAARGRLLVSTDDDCFVARDYLAAHLAAHGTSERRVVTGPIIEIGARVADVPGRLAQGGGRHTNPFPGCNGSVTKAFMERAGLYDTDFTMYGWEDLELWERFRAAGALRRYAPAAGVLHFKPPRPVSAFPGRLRQEIMRGTMGALFLDKYPKLSVAVQTKQWGPIRALDAALDAALGLDRRLRHTLQTGEVPASALVRFLLKEHAEVRGRELLHLITPG
ncbi:MAG: glycosyltransferase [Paracoccaceae bacterium]|nr:glycosyltransferase [Paracoccaceae bacterium]